MYYFAEEIKVTKEINLRKEGEQCVHIFYYKKFSNNEFWVLIFMNISLTIFYDIVIILKRNK